MSLNSDDCVSVMSVLTSFFFSIPYHNYVMLQVVSLAIYLF